VKNAPKKSENTENLRSNPVFGPFVKLTFWGGSTPYPGGATFFGGPKMDHLFDHFLEGPTNSDPYQI